MKHIMTQPLEPISLNNPQQVIPTSQWLVAEPWLRSRCRERRHLSIYLSGAHAYGFPSPDSDLDLKCVHIAPTVELVGLAHHTASADQTEIVDGVELDYTSNELSMVLRGVLTGNGNYIERFLGNTIIASDSVFFASAVTVVTNLLSRRLAAHYAGFATSQLRLFEKKPTAKRALYVFRTAATGRALLATGRLVTDLRELPQFCPIDISDLLAIKLRGEQSVMTSDAAATLHAHLQASITAVDDAVSDSVLPGQASAAHIADAHDWLVQLRRECF
jgi:uncharacterized protein